MSPLFTSPEVTAYYLYVEVENFPTGQSRRVLQSWYTGGGPEQFRLWCRLGYSSFPQTLDEVTSYMI